MRPMASSAECPNSERADSLQWMMRWSSPTAKTPSAVFSFDRNYSRSGTSSFFDTDPRLGNVPPFRDTLALQGFSHFRILQFTWTFPRLTSRSRQGKSSCIKRSLVI